VSRLSTAGFGNLAAKTFQRAAHPVSRGFFIVNNQQAQATHIHPETHAV
jgi:hypothetical protein